MGDVDVRSSYNGVRLVVRLADDFDYFFFTGSRDQPVLLFFFFRELRPSIPFSFFVYNYMVY